ncbi:two-component regulator propeller domain-containing protein [Dysgonomonas sp.]
MKNISFLVCILFFNLCLCSQNTEYKNITNLTGLSNSSIITICQDSSNIMWFGTWDGLNAFNGKEFKIYKSTPDKNSICNNVVRDIIEQRKGILWIATDHGISRMNVKQNHFERFYFGYEKNSPALPEIYSIVKSKDNTLFASVLGWGLSYYDETTESFCKIETRYVETMNIKQMKIDSKNRIWILHTDGTVSFFEWLKNKDRSISALSTEKTEQDNIIALYAEEDYIIMLNKNNVIHAYNTNSSGYFTINYKSILGNTVLKNIKIIRDNIYLIPASGGYYSKPLSSESDFVYNNNFKDINITSVYESIQDILWIATDGNGVYMKYEKYKLFNTVSLREKGTIVRAITEDKNNNLWVATKGNGIYIIKNSIKNPSVIKHYDTKNGLTNNSVYAISKYRDDLFIGSDGAGLNVFTNNKLTELNLDKIKDKIDNFQYVYSIYPIEKDSTLWIGTCGCGLIKLKVQKNIDGYEAIAAQQYVHNKDDAKSLSNNVIYTIVPDKEGYLWVGTRGGGLSRFNTATGEFEAFVNQPENDQSLSSNDIVSMMRDTNGNLWVGTSSGLNKLSFRENNIHYKQYDKELPNNTIHGIIEDDKENIWVSTSMGLAKINILNDQITSYYVHDGLQNNEFSDGAYYKSPSNGYLYFGGISGYNVFEPGRIKTRSYIPAFHCSSFKIFNETEDISGYMKENKLVLKYDENFFSFNFQSIDYIQNENCEYKYKLEGFDKEWITNGNSGYITYTNVKPGEYTLYVSYTNGDKIWIATPYSLPIIISPPWRQTPLAYIIYSLLIIASVFIVFRWIKKRVQLNRQIFLKTLEKVEQENIHEAKLRFFTNIAHELSTPITLIYGPCERILEYSKNDEYITRYIKLIKSSAERMKELIQELMEFRKAESGYINITIQELNISQLVKQQSCNFEELIEENQIRFSLDLPYEEILWESDKKCIEKIFFNLISNAFKYTPRNGYIEINIDTVDDNLRFKITNSGKGIKAENIHEIFDRFRILNEFEDGIEKGKASRNGIGLALSKTLTDLLKGTISVESEVDCHTTFIVSLPRVERSKVEAKPQINIPENENYYPHVSHQLATGKNEAPLVMIIDDETEIREFLYEILKDKYPNIMLATDGRDALQQMKTKRPNLIICDVMMPNMNGIEVLNELKSNMLTNHLPVIFLTAKSSIEDQILATQNGADVYIRKPFHPDHIVAAVDNMLLKHNLIRDFYDSSATAYKLLENGSLMHKDDMQFLLELTEYIEKNMEDTNLSVDSVCRGMNISNISMYRKMKTLVDKTPCDFIREVKLNTASRLLKTTNLTIQEIMYLCGFNSKSYFYREFKKINNLTPTEYRNISHHEV